MTKSRHVNYFISIFQLVAVTCLCIAHGEIAQAEESPSNGQDRWSAVSVVTSDDIHFDKSESQSVKLSSLQSNSHSNSNLASAPKSYHVAFRDRASDDGDNKRALTTNPQKNVPSPSLVNGNEHGSVDHGIGNKDENIQDSDEYYDEDDDDLEDEFEDPDDDDDLVVDNQDKTEKTAQHNNNGNTSKKSGATPTKGPSRLGVGGNVGENKNKNNINPQDVDEEDFEDDGDDEYDDNDDDLDDNNGNADDDDLTDGEDVDSYENNADSDSDSEFRREDLIDAVTELERDAQVEEQSGLLPQVWGLVGQKGKGPGKNKNNGSSTFYSDFEGPSHIKHPITSDDTTLPEDLSDLDEGIVDDIEAGVEESLLLSDKNGKSHAKWTNETETRQFPMYLFQGQYMPEPRLNRFIDGAIRNMGSELRLGIMDPLYFRVLPRGRVESRPQPVGKFKSGLTDIIPKGSGSTGSVTRNGNGNGNNFKNKNKRPSRQLRFFNTSKKNKKKAALKAAANKKSPGVKRGTGGAGSARKRRVKNRRRRKPVRTGANRIANNRNPGKRRKFFRRRKPANRRPGGVRRKRPNNGNRLGNRNRVKNANNRNPNNRNRNRNRNKNRNNKNKKKPGKNGTRKNKRQKRRVKRNVGGGRVEGLSIVQRDGDAEMQAFGNYTLIRSHMKMGPVELSMQFRTRRGLRRTGATLPVIRMHTVTRVSMEGSEMIDFLLDRPHPESIKVRGKLFPLAQRIARNIFSRLFVPNSFLTSRLREKSALALLSKPKK